jgi:hypothetical protein
MGYVPSEERISYLYEIGEGVRMDIFEAERWRHKAGEDEKKSTSGDLMR